MALSESLTNHCNVIERNLKAHKKQKQTKTNKQIKTKQMKQKQKQIT